jgi:hypothetical protein
MDFGTLTHESITVSSAVRICGQPEHIASSYVLSPSPKYSLGDATDTDIMSLGTSSSEWSPTITSNCADDDSEISNSGLSYGGYIGNGDFNEQLPYAANSYPTPSGYHFTPPAPLAYPTHSPNNIQYSNINMDSSLAIPLPNYQDQSP